ncbi:Amidase 1 [Vitis vinifera]|uniref:Amidase 1 n=1 Tax=Vitis vinifera TaxID=29760 RepID=A0A438KCC1_VITVI|nr:Amidase 1 [Vitis vinifera]
MAKASDYGAFMERFILQPSSSSHELPLNGLTFAVKDIFDVDGYVTGFGNPDWARTHQAAMLTAPSVFGCSKRRCHMCCINGENKHYGTPTNPQAPDRVPGGSSSGSAVAVGAMLVDFSLGTDTGGSVRVPASYCGIFGIRPSHGVVSTTGVIPMAQSFDTVGWFARDPEILNRVGHVLLPFPDVNPVKPSQIIIPEDCFRLLSIPIDRVTQVLINQWRSYLGVSDIVKHVSLGDYVEDKVTSLKPFMSKENQTQEYNIPSLAALSTAMRLLQRYEFKNNHGEWVRAVQPDLGPGIRERDSGVLVLPTVPGPPPKLQTDPTTLESFRARAFSLLSIAGVSGFCQVSIPLGLYDNLPVAVSLLAKHGSDGFLLNLVQTLYGSIKEQVEVAEKTSY